PSAPTPALHSFPTRRSSDLRAERVAAAARPDRVEPDVLHVRTVEAQDFVLKDGDGRVYARLSVTPSLTAMDPNGRSPRLYDMPRSEEHTSELQSRFDLVCRL